MTAVQAKARDWLTELRAADNQELFASLINEMAEAAPELESEACELAHDLSEELGRWTKGTFEAKRKARASALVPSYEGAKEVPLAPIAKAASAVRTIERRFPPPAVKKISAQPQPTPEAVNGATAKPLSYADLKSQLTAPEPEEEAKADVAAPTVEAAVKSGELVLGNSLVVGGSDAPNAAYLNELLAAMNDRHAVIGNVGGKCKVIEWVPSELDPGALVPAFQSKADFFNRYAHRQVGWRRGEPLSAGQWWFEHPSRADYRGVVFKPGKPAVISRADHGDWLNLWRGWGVVPQKGRWPLMRNHIEQILSAGDAKAADYNIRWTAWGFQHPDERTEAALVFRGKKGAGKGLLLGTLRMIYGPHGLQITHASHLTGSFNAHLWSCCYLFADEAFWAGDKQGEAVLKGLITERPLPVTKKGVDTFFAVNCVKLAMSSNSDWVVPASHDERRYAVNDIDPRFARGTAPEEVRKEYFGAIAREIRDGGAEAMLYDLLQMNLGDWHPREVPMTTGLMRQKKESLRGNFQWFEPLLQSGTLPATCGRPNRITTEALVAHVRTFRGLEYATDQSIASFLYDEMGFIRALSPEGNKFRGAKGGARGWEFPPLLECRERWETKFGGGWDWHNPEVTEWQRQWPSIVR